jgi:hypothetical protein
MFVVAYDEQVLTAGVNAHLKKPRLLAVAAGELPHTRVCSYCNADLFNTYVVPHTPLPSVFCCRQNHKFTQCRFSHRFVTCDTCTDEFDLCLRCVVEGRRCVHTDSLQLVSHMDSTTIQQTFEQAREAFSSLGTRLGLKNTYPDHQVRIHRCFTRTVEGFSMVLVASHTNDALLFERSPDAARPACYGGCARLGRLSPEAPF